MTPTASRTSNHSTIGTERSFVDHLLDTVEALVVVLDTDRRIVRFNQKCEELTGYSAAEAKGEDLVDLLIPPEEREPVLEMFGKLSDGEAPTSHENHWLTQAGNRRYIQWSNTVLRDEEGRVEHVVGTGIDITKRRRLERKLVTATDQERRRIGAELHDMLAPKLAGTAMMVDALANKLDDEAPEVAREIQTAAEHVREASEQTRTLSHALMPLDVKSGDLSGGLRDLAERQEQLRDLTCSFTETGRVPTLSEQTTTHLYHIASEAVINAAQHANASTVTLSLDASAEQLGLEVRDDGVGIPEETSLNKGAGLHLMEARAKLIGADLEIRPVAEGGTLVQCSLPLSDSCEAPT